MPRKSCWMARKDMESRQVSLLTLARSSIVLGCGIKTARSFSNRSYTGTIGHRTPCCDLQLQVQCGMPRHERRGVMSSTYLPSRSPTFHPLRQARRPNCLLRPHHHHHSRQGNKRRASHQPHRSSLHLYRQEKWCPPGHLEPILCPYRHPQHRCDVNRRGGVEGRDDQRTTRIYDELLFYLWSPSLECRIVHTTTSVLFKP